MVTIKNRAAAAFLFAFMVGALLFATGCKPPGVRALLDGKRLLEKGKYTAAVKRLKTAISMLPNNAHAWNYFGLACHNANQPNEAVQAYQKAIALDPNLAEARYNFGCLLLEQNKPAAARAELTTFVMSRPKDAGGWLRLGMTQWRTLDFAAAEKSLSESLRLDGKNAEAWNLLGLIQLQRNRPREAASYFATALKYQPDYAPALLNSAILHHQYLGDRATALHKYREYLALKPSLPNQNAVANLARALEAELNPPATSSVAVARLITPPTKGASPEVAPTPSPELPRTNVLVTNLPTASTTPEVVKLTNKLPIKVAQDVSVAATDAPPKSSAPKSFPRYKYRSLPRPTPGNRAESEVFFSQGLQAYERRKLADALADFRSAVKADPSYFNAHYNLGWVAFALKNWVTALDAYETALVIDPDSVDARYNFALTLKEVGYPQDAVNELERVLARRPEDAAAHFALANLYAKQLIIPKLARLHYQKVLELDPRHPQGTQIRYWLAENLL